MFTSFVPKSIFISKSIIGTPRGSQGARISNFDESLQEGSVDNKE